MPLFEMPAAYIENFASPVGNDGKPFYPQVFQLPTGAQ
jgi:hypothetical protein